MGTRQVALSVNGVPIELDYFVQGFIDHAVGGMLESLEGTGEIETVNLSIDGDSVGVTLNNVTVPVNPFVTRIIKSTVIGMVSTLKGVGEVKTLNINIKR